MHTVGTIVIAGLLVAAICLPASAFSKRPVGSWNYYHFDGSSFVAGQPSAGGSFIALREQMSPVVVTGTAHVEEAPLSNGMGAIAGICYVQRSGGKLANVSAYAPVPKTAVLIFSGGKLCATVKSDDYGYFVAPVAVGRYSVFSGPAMVEVMVENGTTVLVPLRTGKRMVD